MGYIDDNVPNDPWFERMLNALADAAESRKILFSIGLSLVGATALVIVYIMLDAVLTLTLT